jgi:hypothetical protein
MSQLAHHFESAVMALVGEGPIKNRLSEAYDRNLKPLEVADLPEDLRPDFEALASALTRIRPLGLETPAAASVRKMSPTEADDHALTIVRLYGRLLRGDSGRQSVERLTVFDGGGRKPPRFLTKQGRK